MNEFTLVTILKPRFNIVAAPGTGLAVAVQLQAKSSAHQPPAAKPVALN